MGGSVKDLKSKGELDEVLRQGSPVILHFWASWCEASKHMDQVFSHLATDFPNAHFFRVEAEEQPELSEAFSISAVPFFVFFKDGKNVDTLEGANPSSLANKVAKVAGSTNAGEAAAPASLGMAAGPAVLESVREFAKENGSSRKESSSMSDHSDPLKNRLQELVHSHSLMLFMKGSPEEPKCGFSRKVVEILKEEGAKFGSFDILTDNEVREGLKKFFNWSTFPQLYCKGELLGGSDIVIAMHESGELREILRDGGVLAAGSEEAKKNVSGNVSSPNSLSGKGVVSNSTGSSVAEKRITDKEPLEDRLKKVISSSAVMLFMKGTPDAPRCGFSSKVVNALREEGVSFGSFDILTDEEVRQGLKTFSNWPTFPQLYYKGELIGGCDIVLELHTSGELKSTLSE
ncbi:monothiol glutaredoxin-S17-like [Telopea speciosissima]|uniref:monothiol glutaredoxin-S17-like n=1 Tax=Telopea speciosissima TaxID=54955 RepID=UPI001CC5FFFB|nr:monothiol glutaredoxin-S17-like [Telopea speciosissima]